MFLIVKAFRGKVIFIYVQMNFVDSSFSDEDFMQDLELYINVRILFVYLFVGFGIFFLGFDINFYKVK